MIEVIGKDIERDIRNDFRYLTVAVAGVAKTCEMLLKLPAT